jgi:ribosome maturation factor RimP
MSRIARDELAARVQEIADRVAASNGLEIVEVQMLGGGKSRVLRIYIDKPGGVSHVDCELVSHELGAVLDTEDIIPGGAYTLEVSSPGVERKLTKPRDFERFVGHKVKVALLSPVDGQRRWEGTLAGCTDGLITIEAAAGQQIRFPLEQIERANLKFEW